MGSSARYQGKFDALTIHSTLAGSTWSSTKEKYIPFVIETSAGSNILATQAAWIIELS
jgi:type IV secretory pathway TrbF-like protein